MSEDKKLNPYSMFETDHAIEKQGIIIDYGDFQFKIARAGGSNSKFDKAVEIATKPYRRAIENNSIDKKIVDGITKKVFAKTVVLGWKGVTDKEGNEIEFTVDNCVSLFNDLPDLFQDLSQQAQNYTLFKKEIEESEAKN